MTADKNSGKRDQLPIADWNEIRKQTRSAGDLFSLRRPQEDAAGVTHNARRQQPLTSKDRQK